jgi:hypothetical protein
MSFFILGLNLVSQLLCVSGVNKLSSVRLPSTTMDVYLSHASTQENLLRLHEPGSYSAKGYLVAFQHLVVRKRLQSGTWHW